MLAAESVSQASILRDIFPGGVFWLNIGKMADGSGAVDKAALLEKVQNFIVRMDINRHRPLNLESTTDYLQVLYFCMYMYVCIRHEVIIIGNSNNYLL